MRTVALSLILATCPLALLAQAEPKTAEEFYARAQQSLGPKQFDRVIEDCSQALTLEPDFHEALLLRATAYSNLKQHGKAIADVDVVLRMHPRASTFVFRGNQEMMLGRYEAAAADFNEAIRRTPGSPAAYELRANTRQMLGDVQGAREDRAMASQLASEAPAVPGMEGVLKMGPGISAPKIVYHKEPSYSEEARKAKVQGNVVLSLVVDAQGLARDFKVVVPLGYGLDEKAIEAVQHWKFQPAMKDGRAVAVQSTIEVTFRLL